MSRPEAGPMPRALRLAVPPARFGSGAKASAALVFPGEPRVPSGPRA
jgi:hypothetical protein